MNENELSRVIISGGGTGGHIFPALSIADEIKAGNPGADILFVGAMGRMEMEKVPEAGYPIKGLPVMGMPRKLSFGMFTFIWRLYRSMMQARRIVRQFKPDVVVGVGGFASGPVLKAATRQGVPAVLQEQNSYAGVTNRLLASKVKRICVAWPEMDRYFPRHKIVFTGNPVRHSLLEPIDRQEALEKMGLAADKPVALILGGSQGARTINESVMSNLALIGESGVQVIWQTGKLYYREMMERLDGGCPVLLKPVEFLTDMRAAYKAADLVISRAGAGTISELCLLGKPSVLVPSPNVAEDHQTKNAMALVRQGAAVMVKDNEAGHELLSRAFSIVVDRESLSRLGHASRALAMPDAAGKIADVIRRVAAGKE